MTVIKRMTWSDFSAWITKIFFKKLFVILWQNGLIFQECYHTIWTKLLSCTLFWMEYWQLGWLLFCSDFAPEFWSLGWALVILVLLNQELFSGGWGRGLAPDTGKCHQTFSVTNVLRESLIMWWQLMMQECDDWTKMVVNIYQELRTECDEGCGCRVTVKIMMSLHHQLQSPNKW